ncbi:hypothetical protein L6452_28017 [Arctium lappa]|uniref:Uncharacterized protein n=1 Tax=Arctium lappa TaxID=4217 RepID=A0ACB8ZWC7_ARCLA|nr:hypothetical protein L6452_28017 [Arctium lappa]
MRGAMQYSFMVTCYELNNFSKACLDNVSHPQFHVFSLLIYRRISGCPVFRFRFRFRFQLSLSLSLSLLCPREILSSSTPIPLSQTPHPKWFEQYFAVDHRLCRPSTTIPQRKV